MTGLMNWLSGEPLGALYLFIFLAALIEGVLPVMPGDVAAALLAFLAARAGGDLVPTIALVTSGSILGAITMWWIGRRFGAEWLARVFHRMGWMKTESRIAAAEHRVAEMYGRYGWVALFVSRFLPGVRSVVPAVAGAMKVPLWEVTAIFTVASTIWYGMITWIAFNVGRDWESVQRAVARFARDVGLGAVAIALVVTLIAWRLWRRKRAARKQAASKSE